MRETTLWCRLSLRTLRQAKACTTTDTPKTASLPVPRSLRAKLVRDDDGRVRVSPGFRRTTYCHGHVADGPTFALVCALTLRPPFALHSHTTEWEPRPKLTPCPSMRSMP